MVARSRTWAWPLPLAAALLGACGSEDAPAALELSGARPNIVLLVTDDQRWDTLHCSGADYMRTPNLDWLATRGVLFEQATVATARCCPSRATILTGTFAHRHGVLDNQDGVGFPGDAPFLPRLLQRAGYETAFVGKWHLPNPGAAPVEGFDRWVSFERQGEYLDTVLNVDGRTVQSQGFSTDVLTEYAREFVRRPRERPFFLLVAPKNCHTPFEPPRRHRGRLLDAPIYLPESLRDDPDRLPRYWREIPRSGLALTGSLDEEYLLHQRRRYLQLVLSVDDCMHGILQALFDVRAVGDTLIAMTSDNGFLWGEHGLLAKSTTLDPSLRVPLLIAWPGWTREGAREMRPVQNVDLAPTFLELAGVPAPEAMQGASLVPLLGGRNVADGGWRRATFHCEPRREGAAGPREFCLRGERWKYVALLGAGLEELLFDRERDPDERTNLAADPERRGTLLELRGELSARMVDLDVPAAWRADLETAWAEEAAGPR